MAVALSVSASEISAASRRRRESLFAAAAAITDRGLDMNVSEYINLPVTLETLVTVCVVSDLQPSTLMNKTSSP